MADDVLHSGVGGVRELMVMPGIINLDFADIRTVVSEMGKAMMGTGEAEGERRGVDAAEAAINNPLLEDVSMKGARGVLINITGGTDMTLFEVDEAANRIREEVDPEANIIFGSTFDEKLAGRMRISVVATGIDAENAFEVGRAAVTARPLGVDPALREPASGYTQPILTQNAAAPRTEPSSAESAPEQTPAAAAAAESAALRNGAFIAPRPAHASPSPALPERDCCVSAGCVLFDRRLNILVGQIAAGVQQSVTKSDLRRFRPDVTLRVGIVSFGTFRMLGDMGIAPQRTLKSSIGCRGVGLHSGQPVAMTMRPGRPDSGIVFRRLDAGIEIRASWSNTIASSLSTVLSNGEGVRIGTIEHLMAALADSSADNAIIETGGPEARIIEA